MNEQDRNKRTSESDEIARLAYQLWEEAGRPEGLALEHWLEAELKLRSGDAGAEAAALSEGAAAIRPARRRSVRYGLVMGS